MKTKIIFSIIIFFGLFGTMKNTFAATINTTDCTQAALGSAIDSASTGDTITIKGGAACNATWQDSISIPSDKKITIQGGGKNITKISMSSRAAVFFLNNSGSRITGIGFNEASIFATGYGSRIDHCSFTFSSWTDAINAGTRDDPNPTLAATAVLIDNNDFIRSRVLVFGTNCMFTDGCGIAQHKLWAYPPNLGDENAVYVEHNTFTSEVFGNAIDCNYGGRFVFRFNAINDSGQGSNSGLYIESHSVQGPNRACSRWEIYGNTLNNTGGAIYEPFRLRGGTGVAFNNSVLGNWTNYEIALDNVRSRSDEGPFDQGYCNGSSNWDQNTPGQSGYACRDQIGYGYDAVQWSPGQPWNQVKMPVYEWNNKKSDGTTELPYIQVVDDIGNPIQANRDYYNYTSSFNGTSGMGSGTLANRPAACMAGVAYWATDQGNWNQSGSGGQGILYKCTATNTWSSYYTPLTNPHPLASGSAPPTDTTPPSAPQGLSVQ